MLGGCDGYIMAWDWAFTVMEWSLLFSILQGVHYLTSDGALSRINQINESMIFYHTERASIDLNYRPCI